MTAIKKVTKLLIKNFGYYPPFWATGISVKEVSSNLDRFKIQMKLRFYNQNFYKSHFGGSLYTMCDPFFALILHFNLGDGYIVVDKNAYIEYITAGKGTVYVDFHINNEKIEAIKSELNNIGKNTYQFTTKIVNKDGSLVALVKKGVFVKKKT
jgi:hypothetical protein